MADLFLGVDAGGTKTDACLIDVHGTVHGFGSAGSGNWEVIGLQAAGAALDLAVGTALRDAGAERDVVVSAAFAMAGVDWPSDVERLSPVVGSLELSGRSQVMNDAFAALRAGTPDGVGVVSIAGTGGLTAGRSVRGEVFRTMGLTFGEGAGAHGIVVAALDAVARSRNGHGRDTVISSRFLERTGVRNLDEMFERFARSTGFDIDAEYAPIVLTAAVEGDQVASEIVSAEGRKHGEDVVAVARDLSMLTGAARIVRAGGVHTRAYAPFDEAFVAALREEMPRAIVDRLSVPPVAGAALLALEAHGSARPELTDRVGRAVAEARAAVRVGAIA